MDLRNRTDRQLVRCELTNDYLQKLRSGDLTETDEDIYRLTDIALGIMPGSLMWRSGYISTLNRAIKTMKKEAKQCKKR